jgi:hypothetical protein
MKPYFCTSLVLQLLSWAVQDHPRSTASSHGADSCTAAWTCSNAQLIAVSVRDACSVDDAERDGDFVNHSSNKTSCSSPQKAFRACTAVAIPLASVAVVFPAQRGLFLSSLQSACRVTGACIPRTSRRISMVLSISWSMPAEEGEAWPPVLTRASYEVCAKREPMRPSRLSGPPPK